MINRIIDISVRHKALLLCAVGVACLFGWWSMKALPLDATPDLSETQVIVYSRWDRSPDIIEDQVTYPIVNAMEGAPKVKTVRGISDFGYSYVYVVFEDGTDLYWARSRTLEYLSSVTSRLPEGVKVEMGPDATSLGWVFQYALVDSSGKHNLAELRSYQDWYLRYYLKGVPGVAEVAPIGGYTKQYQVNVDPNRLQAYGIPIRRVVDAVREGNSEVGGRLLEFGGTEYMIRGRGYAQSIEDFQNIVLQASEDGTTIRIKDVGQVVEGPELRRGLAESDGKGEVVSGVVIMRNGENALEVIGRVKRRLSEIEPSLPEGVKIVPVYDRSVLINHAIDNVETTILEVIITVVLIILVFLWHFPSAVIPIITMPVVVLLSFIPLRLLGISANIMSLAGVAIAFSELVDASIVVVEQTHKKLELWEKTGRRQDCRSVVLAAIKEVAAPTFFALLTIAISFLPVLTLEAQEGRMFKPLAYSKSLAMFIAAGMAITFDPALRLLFTRIQPFAFRPSWLCRAINALLVGKIRSEDDHLISRWLLKIYEPAVRWTLRWKWAVVSIAVALLLVSIPLFMRLGSEFMPPLDEGAILYMPSTMPGISITQAKALLQATDRILMRFPEVDHVLGKAGRAETATDPAPLSMLETLIILKPRSEWRRVPTWYSAWVPENFKSVLRHFTPDTISTEDLIRSMDESLKVPGVINSWTMPIKGRIDMLATGLRTPVGLKISGSDLSTIEQVGTNAEALLSRVKGTRTVFAERTGTGYFLNFQWNREQLARYGLSIADIQQVVDNAIGGEDVTTAVQGRERYPVNVRYMRDYRSDISALERVLVPAGGRQLALGELATITTSSGPAMIRDENGLLTGYVYVDLAGRDPESYVDEASRFLRSQLKLPTGTAITWSGQYEAMERVKHRLKQIVPVTLALVLLFIYGATRSFTKTMIVLLAVPFSAVGAIVFLYLAGYNVSIGVWVGLIALLGIDAETGVYMLLYLDLAYEEALRKGRLNNTAELYEAIVEGAAKRLRPKFMTFATMCIGLFPVLWGTGTGSDVMKRIAAPMVGGICTSFLLELLVYPAIYAVWRQRTMRRKRGPGDDAEYQDADSAETGQSDLVSLRLQSLGVSRI